MSCLRTLRKTRTPPRAPADPPRRRAHQRTGHGTSAHDRPPLIRVVSRETGEPRFWVCAHAHTRPCSALIAAHVPPGATTLYPDAWPSDRGSHPSHATVCHGVREWAREDESDGRREVHGNTCEGAGAGLRTSLRAFHGVHKPYLHLSIATYEAMLHTTRVTPMLSQRMCARNLSPYSGYT
jgi:hypothetical protein